MKTFALPVEKVIGFSLLMLLLLLALGEPVLLGTKRQSTKFIMLEALSAQHWLGTDQFGRDMLARISEGLRISLSLAALCVLSSSIIGVLTGVIAAWCRGWVDTTLNFIANTILALPGLVLILLFAALVPGSFIMLYLAISLVLAVEYFRLVRAITLPVVTGPALENSALMGFPKRYLFSKHICPPFDKTCYHLLLLVPHPQYRHGIGLVYVGLKPPSLIGLMIVELFPYYHEAPGCSHNLFSPYSFSYWAFTYYLRRVTKHLV